jgi:hypothetical protein
MVSLGVVLAFWITGCGRGERSAAPLSSQAPVCDELLSLAFDAASAIPLNPHVKDRARQQEAVVRACLTTDHVEQAMEYANVIPNWRKSSAQASIAVYFARHGKAEDAKTFLDLARKGVALQKDWRGDRVRVKIAQALALLDQNRQASQIAEGVEDSENGKLQGVSGPVEDKEAFDRKMQSMKELLAPKSFDVSVNVLKSCAALFVQEYENVERRAALEEILRGYWDQIPVNLRIELVARMCEGPLEHGEQSLALGYVGEAQKWFDSVKWPLRHEIPLRAKMTKLRYQAGDRRKAQAAIDATFERYRENSEEIINIYRAETLRPIAETYQFMGETQSALMVYKLAVQEGVVNPNSRPRALDLSATCCSLAVCGVAPDAELWSQLRKIREGLGHPW